MCYFTPPSLHSPPPAMLWSTWPPFSLFVCQPKDRGQRPSSLPEIHLGAGLLSLLQRARCTSSNVVSLWCSFHLRIIFSDSGPRGWLVGKELLGNAFYLTTKQVTACVFQSVTCCVGVCMYFHLHHEPTTGGALPSRHCWGVGNHERERSQLFYWVPLRPGDDQNNPGLHSFNFISINTFMQRNFTGEIWLLQDDQLEGGPQRRDRHPPRRSHRRLC